MLLLGLVLALIGQEPSAHSEQLQCDVGPVTKAYGGSEWLVYSCSDQRSLVFVSAPGSPAMPFYFLSSPTPEGYAVVGEGNGAREATRPAYEALSRITDGEREALLNETRAVGQTPQP